MLAAGAVVVAGAGVEAVVSAAAGVAVVDALLAAEVDGVAAVVSVAAAGAGAGAAAAGAGSAAGLLASGAGEPPQATMRAPVPRVASTPAMLETFNLFMGSPS